MEPAKVRISTTDFLLQWEKHPIGHVDKNGKAICYGHTLRYADEDLLVAYRYGATVLRLPFAMAGLKLRDYRRTEVLNVVTAAEDWLIIGYENEPFIEGLKLVL